MSYISVLSIAGGQSPLLDEGVLQMPFTIILRSI